MFQFNVTKFLPILSQVGSYLKMAADHYADLRGAGKHADPDIIAMFLVVKMASWDPQINNKSILDDTTRASAARFLAGVVVNMAN